MKGDMQSPARPHRKSRYGCKACKQRKVKCDETKPTCDNCSLRSIACDYGIVYSATRKTSRSPPLPEYDPVASAEAVTGDKRPCPSTSEASVPRPFTPASTVDGSTATQISELELMHHYTALTCYTLAEDGSPVDQSLWQFHVPRVGFQYRPVMELLLALSAWHLRSLRLSSREEELMLCAMHHFSQALPHISTDLTQLEGRTYDRLFISTALIGLCQFARGPKAGDYMAFTDGEPDGEMYRLLCGAKHIILSGKADQRPSEQSRADGVAAQPLPPARPFRRVKRELNYKPHIRRLETHIHSLAAEDSGFSRYFDSMRVLEELFADRFDTSMDESGPAKPIFHWLFTLSEDYMAALRAKKPIALVIFAHFAVLLNDMRGVWYMQGWSRHVMTGVHKHLHRGYQEWIAWPTEVIGVNP